MKSGVACSVITLDVQGMILTAVVMENVTALNTYAPVILAGEEMAVISQIAQVNQTVTTKASAMTHLIHQDVLIVNQDIWDFPVKNLVSMELKILPTVGFADVILSSLALDVMQNVLCMEELLVMVVSVILRGGDLSAMNQAAMAMAPPAQIGVNAMQPHIFAAAGVDTEEMAVSF